MKLVHIFALANMLANSAAAALGAVESQTTHNTNNFDNLGDNSAATVPVPETMDMFHFSHSRSLAEEAAACEAATAQFAPGIEVTCTLATLNPEALETKGPVRLTKSKKEFNLKHKGQTQKHKNPKDQRAKKDGRALRGAAATADDREHEFAALEFTALDGNGAPVNMVVEDGTRVFGSVWETQTGGKPQLNQTVVVVQPCDVEIGYDPTCHTFITLGPKALQQMQKLGHDEHQEFELLGAPGTHSGRMLAAGEKIIVEVTVVYSRTAANQIGLKNVNGNADDQLNGLNGILHYQGFNNIDFRLKDTLIVDYAGSADSYTELMFAKNPNNVPRDGADQIIFVVAGSEMPGKCGRAFLDCGRPEINTPAALESCMTAVVNLSCFYRHSFKHEIGHLYGLDHDAGYTYGTARFTDAHGYVDIINPGLYWDYGQSTIMSYEGIRTGVYSQNGKTYNGVPIGSPTANNLRVFMQGALEIQQKRQQFAPTVPSVPTWQPVASPTTMITGAPTPQRTAAPSVRKTAVPTPQKTVAPTPRKTAAPMPQKTAAPTPRKTAAPTVDQTPALPEGACVAFKYTASPGKTLAVQVGDTRKITFAKDAAGITTVAVFNPASKKPVNAENYVLDQKILRKLNPTSGASALQVDNIGADVHVSLVTTKVVVKKGKKHITTIIEPLITLKSVADRDAKLTFPGVPAGALVVGAVKPCLTAAGRRLEQNDNDDKDDVMVAVINFADYKDNPAAEIKRVTTDTELLTVLASTPNNILNFVNDATLRLQEIDEDVEKYMRSGILEAVLKHASEETLICFMDSLSFNQEKQIVNLVPNFKFPLHENLKQIKNIHS